MKAIPPVVLLTLALAPFASAIGDEPAANEPAAGVIGFVELETNRSLAFDKDIFPILEAKCISCHDAEGGLAEGDLDLMTVEGALRGGKKGPAFISGKGAESLIVRLSSRAEKPSMPPKDEEPLTPEELTLLRTWIDQGAAPGENLTPGVIEEPIVLGDLPPGVHPIYSLDLGRKDTLLVAGRANQVFVYDLPTGWLMGRLAGHRDIVQSVRISPDGQWLASGGFQQILLWRIPTMHFRARHHGHAAQVQTLVRDDESTLVSAATDGSIRVWNLASNQSTAQRPPTGVPIAAMARLGGGDIAIAQDNVVQLLDAATFAAKQQWTGHAQGVSCLTTDGDRVISGSLDGSVRIWLPGLEQAERVLTGHEKPVQQVAVAGPWIVSADDDGKIRRWDRLTGAALDPLEQGAAVVGLAVAPGGKVLAVAGADQSVVLWNLAENAKVATIATTMAPASAMSFDPSGKWLAFNDGGSVVIVDPLAQQVAFRQPVATGAVTAVCFVDPVTVVVGDSHGAIRVCDLAKRWDLPTTLGPLADRVLALDFSPDGRWLVSGGGVPAARGELALWDPARGQKIREFADAHSDTVFSVRFSPDGYRLASAGADKFLKVHDPLTGGLLRSFEGHTHHVLATAWKNDGTQLASGGADNALKIWNYDAGEQIRTVGGHGNQITGVTFVGGSPMLATSCADRQGRLVNADDGKVARGFGGSGDFLYCVVVSQDGKKIISGGQEGKILIWNADDGATLKTFDAPPTIATAGK